MCCPSSTVAHVYSDRAFIVAATVELQSLTLWSWRRGGVNSKSPPSSLCWRHRVVVYSLSSKCHAWYHPGLKILTVQAPNGSASRYISARFVTAATNRTKYVSLYSCYQTRWRRQEKKGVCVCDLDQKAVRRYWLWNHLIERPIAAHFIVCHWRNSCAHVEISRMI